MFALIIAIIAIALTVYLAVSTLFYGGDALSNGSARALASAFINQGQQISGAHALYKNDNAGETIGENGTTLSELVTDKYLSSLPTPSAGGAWTLVDDFDVQGNDTKVITSAGTGVAGSKTLIADEICTIIAEQAGTNNETFGCAPTNTTTPVVGQNTVWYRM